MIADFYLEPGYWLVVLILTLAGTLAARARILSFEFVALGFAAQYTVHSWLAFGIGSPIPWFCTGFLLLFVAALAPAARRFASGVVRRSRPTSRQEAAPARLTSADSRLGTLARRWTQAFRTATAAESEWIAIAKWFLILYWTARLLFYPYIVGELELNVRLEAGQENRLLFFLGQAYLPALGACAALWLRRGYRLRISDYLVLALVVVGVLGSGSKAGVLPIVLLYFGAIAFFGKRLREVWISLVVAGVAVVVFAVRLLLYFPATAFTDVATQFLFRLAANTDSIEYLAAIGRAPSDYPYAGPGALLPMFLKPFGLEYEYPPGVWLHGVRFDEWDGFGPNPGIVMDYYANLGWLGLVMAVLAGLYLVACNRIGGAVGCSFACIAYLLFVDVTLFDLAFFFWAAVLACFTIIAFVLSTRRRARGDDPAAAREATRVGEALTFRKYW